MQQKGRWLSILGTLFLLTGFFLLIGVLFIWLLPPSIPEGDWESQADNKPVEDLRTALLQVPALAPFSAPAPTRLPPTTLSPSANPSEPLLSEPGLQSETFSWSDIPEDMPNPKTDSPPEAQDKKWRMVIPAIGVDAPILSVGLRNDIDSSRLTSLQWEVPDLYAAGWHNSSALPGHPGNTVINGHNNIYGSIFHDLVDLPLGAEITIQEGTQSFTYQVSGREFLAERGESLRDRLRNARWIMPTDDERLTLVTCWPNTSNTHRLVVIAHPAGQT